MRYINAFVHLVLLFTIPSLSLYPQNLGRTIPAQPQETRRGISQEKDLPLLSYDDILDVIGQLEQGRLERRCTLEDLDKINQFLAVLAKQGSLPNQPIEEFILANDIQELLHDDSLYEYAFSFGSYDDYVMAAFDQGEIFLCKKKNWFKKKLHRAVCFVKKHKKKIIIGAAIVVGVVATACVAAAMVPTAAAGAASAAAAGRSRQKNESGRSSSNPSSSPRSQETPPIETPPAFSAVDEAPILKATLEEHVSSFKSTVVENNLPPAADPSLGEIIREYGGYFAHKAFDEVAGLAALIPQLKEEIKGISDRLFPGSTFFQSNELMASKEDYENLVAAGHQKIDQAFSTDYASCYTPEAKANRATSIAIAMLPLQKIS